MHNKMDVKKKSKRLMCLISLRP